MPEADAPGPAIQARRPRPGPSDADERDRLADRCLEVLDDAFAATEDDAENAQIVSQLTMIAEALAAFVTLWGCRYGTLHDDVDRAQAALVTTIGSMILEPGDHALQEGTPLMVAALAHLIGWVCILDVPEMEDA